VDTLALTRRHFHLTAVSCVFGAIDADTKLVPSWRVGDRSGETAIEFVCDLSKRLRSRVQVTSDGLRSYIESVQPA
jgi:hypothetical protein